MTQSTITAGDSTANSIIFAGGDDNTLAIKVGAAGSKVNAVVYAADGTPTFLKVPVNAAVQSMVRVNAANGYGSTNTRIRRFTTVVTNQGSDITYADSATLGASFTINVNGVYAISYTDTYTAANTVAISLNTANPTTNADALPLSEILSATSSGGAALYATCGSTVYLPSGSVIRPHNNGAASSGSFQFFTITRVA